MSSYFEKQRAAFNAALEETRPPGLKQKRPHWLKNLTVSVVALVDRGANCTDFENGECVGEGSHVMLLKRDDGDPKPSPEKGSSKMEIATKETLLDSIEGLAKHEMERDKSLRFAAAVTKVANANPDLYERYCRAPRAIQKPAYRPEADPIAKSEALANSPTAKIWLQRFRKVQKAFKGSLSDFAVQHLENMAVAVQARSPKLSFEGALIKLISEGLSRPDITEPDPVRFLIEVIDDEKNALVSAEDALKIDTVRESFAANGLSTSV